MKDRIEKVNRQMTDWEKISILSKSNKGIDIQNIQTYLYFSKKRTGDPGVKWAKDLVRQFEEVVTTS